MNSELPDGYEISTDAARLDPELIHQWLSQDAYWALGRPREKQDPAIANSLNFGVYDSAAWCPGRLRPGDHRPGHLRLALRRVHRPRRTRQGPGHRPGRRVRDHLAPYGLRRILLATADAHEIYAKVGFAPLAKPERWMALGAR